jgi:2'-5' RNA ligase superfamily protein
MVHSVELLFDPDSDGAIRQIWDDLAGNGIRSQAASTSTSNRPHTTLTVAENMDDAVDGALRPLLALLPLSCTLGAPMVFGHGPFTLVRLLVPSAALLELQARTHQICLPHMPAGPLPHTAPGGWTPHVTLARRVPADQLAAALALRTLSRDHAVSAVSAVGIRHWDGDAQCERLIS